MLLGMRFKPRMCGGVELPQELHPVKRHPSVSAAATSTSRPVGAEADTGGLGPAVERTPRGCLKRAPHSTMPKQTSMEAFLCEPALGVEGRHASGTRSGNGLTVGFVAGVTTPENAIDIRVG